MIEPHTQHDRTLGFTLIELSIVLVIIGLIAGGIVAGRELISQGEIRAQISQIEKYTTAMNTFRGKYNCLPGDCAKAASFGFKPRGVFAGQGDGNSIIQGSQGNQYGWNTGHYHMMGETILFWVDLSQAGLISEKLTVGEANNYSAAPISSYLPYSKVGKGTFTYLWSNSSFFGPLDMKHYFTVSQITAMVGTCNVMAGTSGVSVAQAFAIDTKIDDGLPGTGRLTPTYFNGCGSPYPTLDTTATTGSASTCFANGNVGGATQRYSMDQDNGSRPNCGLSFEIKM